jgi:hypothetical protein
MKWNKIQQGKNTGSSEAENVKGPLGLNLTLFSENEKRM